MHFITEKIICNYSFSFFYEHFLKTDSEEFWEEDTLSDSDDECIPPPLPQPAVDQNSAQQQSLVLWLIGFLVHLQARYNIPDSAIGRLVLFLYTCFRILGRFSTFIVGLADQFPSSLYRGRC